MASFVFSMKNRSTSCIRLTGAPSAMRMLAVTVSPSKEPVHMSKNARYIGGRRPLQPSASARHQFPPAAAGAAWGVDGAGAGGGVGCDFVWLLLLDLPPTGFPSSSISPSDFFVSKVFFFADSIEVFISSSVVPVISVTNTGDIEGTTTVKDADLENILADEKEEMPAAAPFVHSVEEAPNFKNE